MSFSRLDTPAIVSRVTDVKDLDFDDRMTYWVGRVARNEARLELALVGLYEVLVGPGLGWASMPPDIRGLITGCRDMLRASRWGEPATEGVSLLKEIGKQHDIRNRLVHDLWISTAKQPADHFEQIVLRGPRPSKPTVRRLAEFEECATYLEELALRTIAMEHVVGILSNRGGMFDFNLESNRAFVRGEGDRWDEE